MNKVFKITIDGKTYSVEVEEVKDGTQPSQTVAPRPKSAAPPAPIKVQPAATQGSSRITSPMPGTVLELLVGQGDKVEAGQPVLLLEAMKMENKITATATGTIASIDVSQGQSVDTGQLLLTIE